MRNGPYTLLVAPVDYPGKKYRGRYAYEHHIVFWREHGRLPTRGEVIHHRNEKKTDNEPMNLQEMSKGEHAAMHNRERRGIPVPELRGMKNPQSKLTDALVLRIRKIHAEQGFGYRRIARMLGPIVHRTTIHYVLKGRTWKHVQLPKEDVAT